MKKLGLGLAVVLLGSSMVQASGMVMPMPGSEMSSGSSVMQQQRLYNQLKPYLDMDSLVSQTFANLLYPYSSKASQKDKNVIDAAIIKSKQYLTDAQKDALVFMLLSPVLAYSSLNGTQLSTDYQNASAPIMPIDISKCRRTLTTNGSQFICPFGQVMMPRSAAARNAQKSGRTARSGF